MEIVLMRHGKPDFSLTPRVRACEFQQWIDRYNTAGIDQAQIPPSRSAARAVECRVTVCSDLPRSLESARALGVKKIHLSDPLFREMDLPCPDWHTPRLPLYIWGALFRLLWFLGYTENDESFRSSKQRAVCGARNLMKIAAEHRSVLFVGHGLLNHFIARELLSNGWQGPGNPGTRYWEYGVYRYDSHQCCING